VHQVHSQRASGGQLAAHSTHRRDRTSLPPSFTDNELAFGLATKVGGRCGCGSQSSRNIVTEHRQCFQTQSLRKDLMEHRTAFHTSPQPNGSAEAPGFEDDAALKRAVAPHKNPPAYPARTV